MKLSKPKALKAAVYSTSLSLFNYPIVETKSFLPPIQNIFEGGTFLNLNKFEFLKNYWTIFLKAVHTKQLK